jgi:hypothetical protein
LNGGGGLKLGDYAKIRTGLVLSRKKAVTKVGAHQYTALTLKALPESGMIDHKATESYSAVVALKPAYFTHNGDVLLRLSAPYTATLIAEDNEDLLVSSHFTIVRVNQKHINPSYLYWWLTQNRKRFYKVASGGTMMGTISSGYVGQMEIALPPIAEQLNIGNLIQLAYHEQQLLALLAEKRKTLLDSALRSYTIQKQIGGLI